MAENTRSLCKWKYNCTTDLLFGWFGFNQTSKYVTNSAEANQPNTNKTNRSVIQWYIPLRSECSLVRVTNTSRPSHYWLADLHYLGLCAHRFRRGWRWPRLIDIHERVGPKHFDKKKKVSSQFVRRIPPTDSQTRRQSILRKLFRAIFENKFLAISLSLSRH